MQFFLACLVRCFVFKFSYRSVVKEFFNLSDTMMGYFTKVGLFGKKSSDLTDSIFYGPFVLAGIGSGKVGFKAQGESYRLVSRKGFVVVEG